MQHMSSNYLLERRMKNEDCPQGFCMKDVFNLWEKDEGWKRKLLLDDLHPVDKMKFDPVKHLMNISADMENLNDQALKAIGKYLSNLKKWYQVFNDNQQNVLDKVERMCEVHSYFSLSFNNLLFKENSVTKNFMKALEVTRKSFESLCDEYKIIYGSELHVISIFQDIVVENSFSIIRNKCRYPNLWLYEVYQQRGWIELVKKFSSDCPFSQPEKNCSKFYQNQHGLRISLEHLRLLSPLLRKTTLQEWKQKNGGTEEQQLRCEQLAHKFPCSRKKLLIREASCKENPLLQKVANKRYLHCPFENCPKTYIYQQSFIWHLKKVNGEEDFQDYQVGSLAQKVVQTETSIEIVQDELQSLYCDNNTDELHSDIDR